MLPLRVIKDGYRVVQESAAISFDDENPLDAIFRRRRQVATKDFRTLMSMKELLNPFRSTRVAWGLFSHKLLRWFGAAFLFLIFLSPFFLMDDPLFVSIAAFQIVSYAMVTVGWAFRKTGKVPKLLLGACNFLISNVAVLVGIIYHFIGVETGKWEPNRDKPVEHS